MTMGMTSSNRVSKQAAETDDIADDIPMTSQERARHEQRGQAER